MELLLEIGLSVAFVAFCAWKLNLFGPIKGAKRKPRKADR
jgi:hypothetical protein